VLLTAILAIAGCCAACSPDTAQKKTSAHDCCKSKKDAPKKQVPPQQDADCPQCIENRYKSPNADHAALSTPVDLIITAEHQVATLTLEAHAPPLISESARYLRLNTLRI